MPENRDFRMTASRREILSLLEACSSHPTAEEVCTMVRERLPKVSLATVYRNLDLLAREGLISTISVAGEQRRYDGMVEEHHHIRCEVCGRVEDVELSCRDPLEALLADSKGYEVRGCTLCFVGVCGECAGDGAESDE